MSTVTTESDSRGSNRDAIVKATHIRRRGNSAGINLPAKALVVSGLTVDSAVSIEATDGEIIIKAAKPEITLEYLLSQSTAAKLKKSNEDTDWLNDDVQGAELI